MLKNLFLVMIILFFSTNLSALTFPIDEEDCLYKNKKVLLTGWFNEKRKGIKHKAIDIPARTYTPVRAVISGSVIEKGYHYKEDSEDITYGNYVKIKDSEDNVWVYAHLTSYNVKLNELVVEGERIGDVGWTGLGKKHPHLHLEKRNKSNQKVIFTKDFGIPFSLRSEE